MNSTSIKVLTFFLVLFFYLKTYSNEFHFDDSWKALIQSHSWPSQISDPYIKNDIFKAAILDGKNYDLVCKYPARYKLLRFNHQVPYFDLTKCKELDEFIKSAPLEKLSYVFSTESFSDPSSAMGHSYLKISGINHKGESVEHALSFFTLLSDVNPFGLIIKSFFTGKEGYYTLSPEQEVSNHYLFNEGRNLWEYEIKLTKNQDHLLHLYIFELKSTPLDYYFHLYNCGTLIRNILSVAHPQLIKIHQLWTTPLDIVRDLKDQKLINSTKVRYSNTWLIRQLSINNKIGVPPVSPIIAESLDSHVSKEDSYLKLRYLKAVNGYKLEQNQITQKIWQDEEGKFDSVINATYPDFELNLSQVTTPFDALPDSQVRLGFFQQSSQAGVRFSFLPISHELINKSFNSTLESEVKLFEFNFDFFENSKSADLNLLQILNLKALSPHDSITMSRSKYITIDWLCDSLFFEKHRCGGYLSAGLGKTYRIHRDIDFYALFGPQFRLNTGLINGGVSVQIGSIFRQIYGMKGWLELTQDINVNGFSYFEAEIKQAIYFNPIELQLSYKFQKNHLFHNTITSLNWVYLY